MSERKTLTLRPVPYVDEKKLERAKEIGFRFIDRRGRYILQAYTVCYREREGSIPVPDHTWVDIPLLPEVYA
jgi:hypothetical protein